MPFISDWHINCKETLSAVLAARRWGHLWKNCRVQFFTDNMTARACLNKGTSRNDAIMPYLRELFWLSAVHNFHISAEYVRGKANDIPDAISRLHEGGQLRRLAAVFGIPRRMGCHWVCHCLPHSMSLSAYGCVFPQIPQFLQWIWNASLIAKCPNLGPKYLLPVPRPPIEPIGSLTSNFVL